MFSKKFNSIGPSVTMPAVGLNASPFQLDSLFLGEGGSSLKAAELVGAFD